MSIYHPHETIGPIVPRRRLSLSQDQQLNRDCGEEEDQAPGSNRRYCGIARSLGSSQSSDHGADQGVKPSVQGRGEERSGEFLFLTVIGLGLEPGPTESWIWHHSGSKCLLRKAEIAAPAPWGLLGRGMCSAEPLPRQGRGG